jgi:DNA repair ATPase RecN
MTKYFSMIIIGLFLTLGVKAQTPETLTNSSILKLTKAHLSDELIIEMILDSPVSFSLGSADQRYLKEEGVSDTVLEAMIRRRSEVDSNISKPVSGIVRDELKPVSPPQKVSDSVMEYIPAKVTGKVSAVALNYVSPLTDLIAFNDREFESFEGALAEWDKKIRTLTTDVIRIKDQMLQAENALRKMKNAGTGTFSEEILSEKKKLDVYRKNYSASKEMIRSGGKNMLKWIESEMGNRVRDVGKAYSTASQMIMSSDNNPASGEQPVTRQFTTREVSETTSGYIVYATELLSWYQNEMLNINVMIRDWNPRVSKVIADDAELKARLDPLEKKLEELKANARQNKNEISALKKQVSDIEKARKEIADTMKDNIRELASSLKEKNQENQEALKQRFADIIENITYSFEEKLSL